MNQSKGWMLKQVQHDSVYKWIIKKDEFLSKFILKST